MPRFSIVVPSHGVAGRLSLALDSVLAQCFGDFELIPVCDGPGVPAAGVAAGYAARDPRVRPVFSPPSVGLAEARNTGVRAATGAYLLFLDGDDTLAPGALRALADRLAVTGEVDVLYAEHERVPWWEGEPVNPVAARWSSAPDGVFTPRAAPEVAGMLLPAWSAAYRRAFLVERQLHFPGGHFTDVGFGGLVTLHAERAAVLRAVVVRHLLRRQGARLAQPGAHHGELLDQVERVLGARPEQALPHGLFGQLFAVVLSTAARPARLPAADRRAFFRRAGALYRRHLPADLPRPRGRTGLPHRLLAADAYTVFRALTYAHRLAARALRLASRLPRRVAATGRTRGITRVARVARVTRIAAGVGGRLRRIDPRLAVYCAHGGRGYVCGPAALHERAAELAPRLRSVFLVRADHAHAVPAGVEHAVLGTRRARRLLTRAKYLVGEGDFARDVVKRPGQVRLRTPHGTPLRTTGVDRAAYPLAAAAAGADGGPEALLGGADRWDYVLSANPHSTRTWERAFPGAYEPLEYGSPRNDVFYRACAEDVDRIRGDLGVPEGKTAVLYAPAHRDHPVPAGPGLDLAAFCAAAGEDVVVLLHAPGAHPRARSVGGPGGDRVIDVSAHPCVEEVCLAADALVTDYASLMCDYAHLDRPIVLYADDWEVCARTRGLYVDPRTVPPGPVARTPEELAAVFRDGVHRGARSAALRSAFRARFCRFDDGRAAERVVRRVLLGEDRGTIPPVRPLGERIPAPAAVPFARS
ncbi:MULTISPECIES: CDP-glycerol glycerophosphotransferase family protein [unclassified Streptomyces]|uniref:bifunctional glycosyltransferase/CDP-glycerol:glycerophosphate glycerophosphotransferase n=1 Tax=unclassified Streptomyces TaxID=2593676 RepID=UPI00381C064D